MSNICKPFFINSNICINNSDISNFETFMKSIAGNTGNSYITYALIKELFGGLIDIKHIQNIYEYNFDNSQQDIDYINNEATHVFLILQDQIRIQESYGLKLPYKKIIDFVSKLNKPLIVAGLGANSFNGFDKDFYKKIDPELIKFLKFISEHCIEIGIRGYFTEEVLHKIGINNVKVIGCPSFYEMGRDRVINKNNNISTNDIVFTNNLNFPVKNIHKIMQDYSEQSIIKKIAFNTFNITDKISFNELKNIKNKKYHIFSNIEEWKKFIANFSFALGYRLHGAILAINSGVPALCMNGDSRATEMCNYLKIPHNPNLNIKEKKDIIDVYEQLDYTKLNNNYPKIYNDFVNFMNKNNLKLYEQQNNKTTEQKNYVCQPNLVLHYDNNIMLYIRALKFEIKDIIKFKIKIIIKSIIKFIFNIKTERYEEYCEIKILCFKIKRKIK